MINPQDIHISATAAKRLLYVCTVVSYSLAYNDVDVMDNDKLLTALSAQIKIIIVMISRVYP